MVDDYSHDIAIIGMAGRFPGAANIEKFWDNLQKGVEAVVSFSDKDLLSSGVPPGLLASSNYVKSGVILENIEWFDASFFGFSPREAEILDPQQRFFLECAWEALENAACNPEGTSRRIGVYAGTSSSSYLYNLLTNPEISEKVPLFSIMMANDKDHLTTRTSYKLNLRGPSINVNTACSTSLVAVHLACQSLLDGECDIALAGGVSINVQQNQGYIYQEGMILSPDGHCRTFDAEAKGTIDGNGVGIVVLKRLTDAIDDRDYIHAIIKGSAVNNDGSMKVGYTAPSIDGQTEVIKEALSMAEVAAETLSYIEAHGTGTPLGDPIEIDALIRAFRVHTDKNGYCAIGSVKTNIGHLDAAAGVAGLIKTVLALKHTLIPPSLNFKHPNPEIDFEHSPFYVNTTLRKWSTHHTPRRAGVSSFGIGGTNAHVILEEPQTNYIVRSSSSWHLLVLSAKTSVALETITNNLAEHLRYHSDLNLGNVAYTLQTGRRPWDYRRFFVCRNVDDATNSLAVPTSKQAYSTARASDRQPVTFMFPGQGTQSLNMALELYLNESEFQKQIDHCSLLLQPHLDLDLRSFLHSHIEHVEAEIPSLHEIALSQSVLFVIEYALAKQWIAWGVSPDAMIGHSMGEYVAACLAEVFSLEDGLALIVARGKLMQKLSPGAMIALPLSEQKIYPLLGDHLSLAAINGSARCVVSGATEPIAALEQKLDEQGMSHIRLQTARAFHSEMIESILEPFTSFLQNIHLQRPKIPFISNVSGTWITTDEATNPHYWAKHMRQTVLFSKGLEELLKDDRRIFLEVGPGKTLSTLVKQHHSRLAQHTILTSLHSSADRSGNEPPAYLTTLGHLWIKGIQIDWLHYHMHENLCHIPLPTYPFERQCYWIDAANSNLPSLKQLASIKTESSLAVTHNTTLSTTTESLPSSSYSRPLIDAVYAPPTNKIEQAVAEIWQSCLAIGKIGIHDNYFDLGGDSLQATQIILQLRARLHIIFPLSEFLAKPTIAEVASDIEQRFAQLVEPEFLEELLIAMEKDDL